MKRTKRNNLALYIHIPFCEHICSYCDFTKLFYNEQFANDYIKELIKEFDSYDFDRYQTIYIGGGTPTSLNDVLFEKLLSHVSKKLSPDGEFTVEANVENLTKSKLEIMARYKVSRLSIGVQSTSNKRLKDIGRCHTYEDAVKVVNEAKKYNFDSINVDLMFGFKDETKEDLIEDLKNILALGVDHISIYSLIISPGTKFYNEKYPENSQDESREQYDLILKTLRKHGYKRYEISNFARNEKYSRHNVTYWKDDEYVGIGLGASGYLNGVRYENTKNLKTYLSGKHVSNKENVSKDKDMQYFLLTNLRMEDGFQKEEFIKRFGIEFEKAFENKYEQFAKNGNLLMDGNRIRLSDEGLMIMDYILVKLF